MGGKAKPKKHTAKEIKGKYKAATTNKGGGKGGIADRKGGKAGHAKFKCYICALQAPSIKNMQAHFESKHSKLTFEPDKCTDTHALHGGTVQGVGVAGTASKKKKKDKKKKK